MRSVAANLLGNRADAEDAVHEAFVKLYRSITGFKGESQLSTWLFRILVNACHDLGRRRRRSPEAPPVGEGEEARELEPAVAPSDPPLRLTLERLIRGLPLLPRTVFVLFEVEGFKHREIATILGIPEGTSRYALFEAKKALQAGILEAREGRAQA
jgi:RNA polymerase sigma-70 factor (ECF subfamily)